MGPDADHLVAMKTNPHIKPAIPAEMPLLTTFATSKRSTHSIMKLVTPPVGVENAKLCDVYGCWI